MCKPKVSIITPCYNGQEHIQRLIKSILKQTYNNIEFILIDDGSTDNTKEIVLSYKDEFAKKGASLVYLYQENAGQAAALNTGLKHVSGEFLTWIDADDYLKTHSVETRVNTLENTGEGFFCVSLVEFVNENNLEKTIRVAGRKPLENNDNFFEDTIWCTNVVFSGGTGVMLYTKDFIKACPQNCIFVSRHGQNLQMLLPISYALKCVYINEPLYVVVIREESHSRAYITKEQSIARWEGAATISRETVKNMNIPNEDEILKEIDLKLQKDLLKVAIDFNDVIYAKQIKNYIVKVHGWKALHRVYDFLGLSIYKKLRKLAGMLKKYLLKKTAKG